MRFRNILAIAAVAAGIGTLAATADAKTNVHVNIGVGTPGYYYDPAPYPYYGTGYYVGPPVRRIGCARGADILRGRGYRGVYARDCGGGTYSYIGWSRGGRFLVFVNARNGVVLGRRPI